MGQEHRADAATQPITDVTRRDPPLAGQLFTLNQTASILAAVQSIPLNSAATAFNQWIQGFCGHPQKLYVNLVCKERKARRSFPPASPTQKRKTSPPQCSSPGVMKAFFTNKDTVSSFGAGTIFCDCLGLVPALARGTGLGSANVSWDCSWGRGCPCTTTV